MLIYELPAHGALCCITNPVIALPSRTYNQYLIAISMLYPLTLIRISRNIPEREVALPFLQRFYGGKESFDLPSLPISYFL